MNGGTMDIEVHFLGINLFEITVITVACLSDYVKKIVV
jgi:hypothetical protein